MIRIFCLCIYNNILAEGRIADALKYGFLDLDEDMIKGKYYTFFLQIYILFEI